MPFYTLELAIALFLLCPLLGSVAAAVITARHTYGDDLTLLRQTDLTGEQVLGAFTDGITYRMRVVRAIGLGFLPAAAILPAFMVGMVFMGACYSGDCSNAPVVVCGLLPAGVLVGMAIYAFRSFWRAAVHIGIWVGLNGALGAMIAAGLGLMIVLIGSVVCLGFMIGARSTAAGIIALGTLIFTPLAPIFFGSLARKSAIRYFEKTLVS
jgi:hypothetical protein